MQTGQFSSKLSDFLKPAAISEAVIADSSDANTGLNPVNYFSFPVSALAG